MSSVKKRKSNLELFSLGIVSEDKTDKSDYIKVCPIEHISFSNGLIKDQTKQYNVKLPNAEGITKTSKTEGEAIIVAKWIPDSHSNKISAPDVVKGETVKIYRFSDSDKYYWTTVFREPSLRRLEESLFAWGNVRSGTKPFDRDSSYTMTVSTKNKFIEINTTVNDGEPCGYNIKLNTKTGSMVIVDTRQNRIELLSMSDTCNVTTNKKIILKSPNVSIDSKNTVFTGAVNIQSSLNVSGATTTTGISNKGPITSTGNVTAPNIR